MSIATKTGDDGKTSNGVEMIEKSATNPYLMAVGKIDKLGAFLSLACSTSCEGLVNSSLFAIQIMLMKISKRLSGLDKENISFMDDYMKCVENGIQCLEKHETFEGIKPASLGETCGLIHVARTVCREAELYVWDIVKLNQDEKPIAVFLNRVSDFLYLIAESQKA